MDQDTYNDTYKIAKEYSTMLKYDLIPDSKSVEESIDETTLRLEEYSSLISLVIAESNVEKYQELLKKADSLHDIFERINRLEQFILVVKEDVKKVEKLLNTAEQSIGKPKEGTLQSLLKPFFRKSNSVPSPSPQQTNYVTPVLFKTKDYFPDS